MVDEASKFVVTAVMEDETAGEPLTGPKMISPKNHSSLIAKSEIITY